MFSSSSYFLYSVPDSDFLFYFSNFSNFFEKSVDDSQLWCYNTSCRQRDDKNLKNMRKCWNWQTGQTKDLVVIAIVWVQVPSSAEQKLLLMQGFFTLLERVRKRLFGSCSFQFAGACLKTPAQKNQRNFCFEFPLIFLFSFLSEFFCNLYFTDSVLQFSVYNQPLPAPSRCDFCDRYQMPPS